METDKKMNDKNNSKENQPTSQRKCEINGKRFLITRHFDGNQDLKH